MVRESKVGKAKMLKIPIYMEEQFLYSHYSNAILIAMYMLIYVGLYVNKQSKKTGRENVHIETTLSPVLYTDG